MGNQNWGQAEIGFGLLSARGAPRDEHKKFLVIGRRHHDCYGVVSFRFLPKSEWRLQWSSPSSICHSIRSERTYILRNGALTIDLISAKTFLYEKRVSIAAASSTRLNHADAANFEATFAIHIGYYLPGTICLWFQNTRLFTIAINATSTIWLFEKSAKIFNAISGWRNSQSRPDHVPRRFWPMDYG